MAYARNFTTLLVIVECGLIGIVLCQQFITFPFAYSSANNTQALRVSGPVNSIQFSSEGYPLWILSGRWRMDANFDNSEIMPMAIRSFNVTLVAVPMDGSNTERYQLADFKQDSISYDNKTKTSSIKGTITMTSKGQPVENIGVDLRLINKNIMVITLDPTKTRDQLGETPIYGIER